MARLVDLVAAPLALFVLAPLMGAIAWMMRPSDPSPRIIYGRRRIADGTWIGICYVRTPRPNPSRPAGLGRTPAPHRLGGSLALRSLWNNEISFQEYLDFVIG